MIVVLLKIGDGRSHNANKFSHRSRFFFFALAPALSPECEIKFGPNWNNCSGCGADRKAAAAAAAASAGAGAGGNFKENCLNQKTLVCVGAANVTTVKRLCDISA